MCTDELSLTRQEDLQPSKTIVDNVLDTAERAWNSSQGRNWVHINTAGDTKLHMFKGTSCGFMMTMANVGVVGTPAGLVLVDCASIPHSSRVLREVRELTPGPVHTIVYTHGHIDHCMGARRFDKDSRERGYPRPRVIAHTNCSKRFDRYAKTAGYNSVINSKQARFKFTFPSEFRFPDVTYDRAMTIEVGGKTLHLVHGKGETDDATWVWVPEDRVLFTGDLFIWAVPNCGNPQKAQRYPVEWAAALRHMASFRPKILCPGHGPAIIGEERVVQALVDTAVFLEDLTSQTLRLINEGRTLNHIIHSVKPRVDLYKRPYLQPKYDDPSFIIRNMWRHYAGWWDQNPAHLKPAKDVVLAKHVATIAGSPEALATKAIELCPSQPEVATHLVEMAYQAQPSSVAVNRARARIYGVRESMETSLMGSSIFRHARLASEAVANRSKL